MEAQRHTAVRTRSALADTRGRTSATRVPDDVLLDAAKTCVLSAGVRRTTLAEIARTAGVSRMTLYRRFPDVRSVLIALMTREFSALLRKAIDDTPASITARQRLVDGAVSAVRALVANPLMRTVLDVDAELVLPYITQRLGSTQRLAEEALAAIVTEGHRDGSVRRAEPAVQVRAVLLVVQSFVLSLRPATADVGEQALLAELRHILDSALAA
ncbi:transcriptional regulator [Saccharomonospora marina XMU15]|uniref:Transcriptional regulator n=1 Tax=Saccharomonospora marina XMU15 TaxID=882083 RepID=H5WY22_9PSEU|nr:TetR/AcrR family transcriptional regulator [Saccharomonospora marina]EHR52889.1 transcriptional regulator [Saccharomonospora marina XMU15]